LGQIGKRDKKYTQAFRALKKLWHFFKERKMERRKIAK
jgi:hypothetical protein